MFSYLLRRLFYSIPVLLGVNLLTFMLFFMVNSPDDMARAHLGVKHINQAVVDRWKTQHGYDKPLFINNQVEGIKAFTQTLFYQKSLILFRLDFGFSDEGRDIGYDISQRMWPSLAIAAPSLVLGLFVDITIALLMAFFRSTYLDLWGVIICLMMMSVSGLFYIIAGQYLFSKVLHLVPISGYHSGFIAIEFVLLPILIGVIGGMGSGARWYRTIILEEYGKEYVRTVRAKGFSDFYTLYTHVLKNALIPILTGVVVIIPSLFMGSLVMESFFGIPGLGSYTIDAIAQQDFAIVRAMVFLGTILYIIGLMLTDISYTLVDPRVKLN
jgi:peptide/nickel transport system permease protein